MYQNEAMLIQEASKYKLLADYYMYSNPNLHMMYYHKHLRCMQQLAALEASNYNHSFGGARGSGQTAYVRVLHASPDAPEVDVYVNGKKVIEGLAFKAHTDYLQLAPGNYTIEVYPAGEMDQPVLLEKVNLTRNTYYTAAAIGKLANIKLSVFVDKLYVSPNKSKVRFIHLSPDAPNVDIAVSGGPVLFRNVAFGKATDYLSLEPTTANLEVRIAGTNNVVLMIPNVQLQAGKSYTAVAVGLASGMPSLEAIFLMP